MKIRLLRQRIIDECGAISRKNFQIMCQVGTFLVRKFKDAKILNNNYDSGLVIFKNCIKNNKIFYIFT